MGVMRIGHVSLKVMDMEAALRHYVRVLGMQETMRDAEGNVYLKCWDEWDRYSLILSQSDQAGLKHAAYKVEHDADLDALQQRIEAYGIATEMLPEGALPAVGRQLRFLLPSGHELRLFAKKELVGTAVGSLNPDPWPDDVPGSAVHWLDHCLLMCELNPDTGVNRVEENTRFMAECLDFHLAEQVMVGPGNTIQAATWMFRSSTPHDIAFVGGPRNGLHHIAFFLDDWADVLKSADVMAKKPGEDRRRADAARDHARHHDLFLRSERQPQRDVRGARLPRATRPSGHDVDRGGARARDLLPLRRAERSVHDRLHLT